jgi:hypothetical protein
MLFLGLCPIDAPYAMWFDAGDQAPIFGAKTFVSAINYLQPKVFDERKLNTIILIKDLNHFECAVTSGSS